MPLDLKTQSFQERGDDFRGRRGDLGPGAVRPAPPPRPVEEIAPTGDASLWVPIGPSTVMMGQAGSREVHFL